MTTAVAAAVAAAVTGMATAVGWAPGNGVVRSGIGVGTLLSEGGERVNQSTLHEREGGRMTKGMTATATAIAVATATARWQWHR